MLVGFIGAVAIADEPEALRKAREARSAARLYTAQIEYSRTSAGSDGPQFFSQRAAGGRYMVTQQADARGVFAYADGRRPAPPYMNQPRHLLFTEDEVWSSVAGTQKASVFGPDERSAFHLPDLRNIGFDPIFVDADLGARLEAHGLPPLTYEESREGDLIVVTGRSGDSEAKWWIDPQRDWNIVRTRTSSSGEHYTGMDIELRQDPYDGTWFPRRVAWVSSVSEVPVEVLEVHAAQFNRPEHPSDLTPASLGLGVGASIVTSPSTGLRSGIWDGSNIVSHKDFLKRVDAGQISVDPRVSRLLAQLKAGLGTAPSLADWPDQTSNRATTTRPAIAGAVSWESSWEAYTRAFIEHYKLDEEQTERAWDYCRAAQQRGRDVILSRQQKLDRLDQRRDALRAPPEDRSAELIRKQVQARIKLAREYAKLLQPLRLIFDRRLAARLEQLPTRTQKKSAEKFKGPDVWRGVIPFAEMYRLDGAQLLAESSSTPP